MKLLIGEYAETVAHKANPMRKTTVKGSQFEEPLLEFSGGMCRLW